MCINVRLAHSSRRTVCDIADRIEESAKSGTEVVPQFTRMDHTKIMDASLLHFYCIRNKLHTNICILYRSLYTLYIQYIHTQQVCLATSGSPIPYRTI